MVPLHISRLVDWQPSPITHLATSGDGTLGVALREDGDVEFYDLTVPYCCQRTPGNADTALSCAAVVDCGDRQGPRVFVSGFSGSLAELAPSAAAPVAAVDCGGGAVWAMAAGPRSGGGDGGAAPATLALACEDGAVRLFRVDPSVPGASYARTLPAAGGRLTAVAWHPSGTAIAAAGVDGSIHVRDAATGRELARLSLRTAGSRSGLVVWALLYLPDGTLVAGDSSGAVSFWDAAQGTQLALLRQHRADVLTLAASPAGHQVWAAGVDASLALFQRGPAPGTSSTASARQQKWHFVSAKRCHTHDVRALAVAPRARPPHGEAGSATGDASAADTKADQRQADHAGVLLSAGNDGVLLAHSVARFLKRHPRAVSDAPQRPLLAAPPAAGWGPGHTPGEGAVVASVSRRGVDLYSIPGPAPANTAAASAPSTAALEQPTTDEDAAVAQPRHLAHISMAAGRRAACAALSSDGQMLALVDARRLTCLRLGGQSESAAASEHDEGGHNPTENNSKSSSQLAVEAVPVPGPAAQTSIAELVFIPGTHVLAAAGLDGSLWLLDLDTNQANPLRDVQGLKLKPWSVRQFSACAARRWEPAIQHLTPSPDGRWLAFCYRRRLQLVDVARAALVAPGPAPLPGTDTHVAALSFSADSATLAALSHRGQVHLFAVPSGEALEQPDDAAKALPAALRKLGGSLGGLVPHPRQSGTFFVHTTAGICVVDPGKPAAPEPKRQRRPAPGTPEVFAVGANYRLLRSRDVLLHFGELPGGELLAVEHSWQEARVGLPAPLYRHRYGA